MKLRVILMIKIENKNGDLLWIDNEDLILFIKNLIKRICKSKYLY